MSQFMIRKATLADEADILRLAGRFKENGLPPWRDRQKALDWHDREARAILRSQEPDAQVLVAEVDGCVAGFIYFYSQEDFQTGERQGYIADFVVDEVVEGRGLGVALLAEAEAWSRTNGYRVIALDVFAMNHPARAYYARRGFVEQTLKLVKLLEEK